MKKRQTVIGNRSPERNSGFTTRYKMTRGRAKNVIMNAYAKN